MKDKILKQIKVNDFNSAFRELSLIFKGTNMLEEIVLLDSNWNGLRRQARLNLINQEMIDVRTNKIRKALIDLTLKIESREIKATRNGNLSADLKRQNLNQFDANISNNSDELIQIQIESKYTGQIYEFKVSGKVSFKYLHDSIINTIGLDKFIDLGLSSDFKIKWVFVDSEADDYWNRLNSWDQNKLVAIIKNKEEVIEIKNELDQLTNRKVFSGIKFYLYPVEANSKRPVFG